MEYVNDDEILRKMPNSTPVFRKKNSSQQNEECGLENIEGKSGRGNSKKTTEICLEKMILTTHTNISME